MYQRLVPYFRTASSPRKNTYGAPMIYKDLPVHRGHFSLLVMIKKKKKKDETKTYKH
jgi:hypothetical protein